MPGMNALTVRAVISQVMTRNLLTTKREQTENNMLTIPSPLGVALWVCCT